MLFGVVIELRLSCWVPEFLRKILKIFEIFCQPSGPIGKTKPAGSFGSVCWNGSLGGLICLCSWLFGVRIEIRLSCWIPDFVWKILKIFEIFCQPSGLVGKTEPAGSFGSVCWNDSLGGLIYLC